MFKAAFNQLQRQRPRAKFFNKKSEANRNRNGVFGSAVTTQGCGSAVFFFSSTSAASSSNDGAGGHSAPQMSTSSRPKLRLENILAVKKSSKFTFPMDKTVGEAISHLVEENLGSSLAVDANGALSGIFTARDILRFLHNKGVGKNSSSASTYAKEKALSCKVKEIMVKKEKLIFCSPSDTVSRCREIMFQHKIRTVPVLGDGEVLGIITNKDLSDSSFTAIDAGGKKHFLETASGRRGLPEGTRIRENTQTSNKAASRVDVKLALESAAYSLPHPYKKPDGCAQGRRDYGPSDLCMDHSLCEDAHFVINVEMKKSGSSSGEQTYLCVADGVGSWRQYGVDPRNFSHRLVENARKVIESDALQRNLMSEASLGDFNLFDSEPIHPLDIMVDAWSLTRAEKITGSSTICVATLDNKLNQLSYSNLGDCGLLVVRHIDSETAGYMRERQLPRHLRNSDLRIAYLSQQQLRSFNLPYQLGYSGIPEHSGTFETPSDANTASIAIQGGDLILLATDGLFDNLDLQEIVEEISRWESKYFPSGTAEELSQQAGEGRGEEAMQALAKAIVYKARELSLDTKRDSPFAVLAKENDILWSGGMPDDTTVAVARVVVRP